MASGFKPKSARTLAAELLDRIDLKSDYAGRLLEESISQTGQRQRATDLVFGTIRNRSTIDRVISAFADCPVKRINADILDIIRIGAYELIYCPSTADYSIVDEAVKNAKETASQKQADFVNAVLRQLSRHISCRRAALKTSVIRNTIPQNLSSGCEFDTAILPDPCSRAADYLSAAFSLPRWLVCEWLDYFGTDATRGICFASNRRPSIYLHPNILKTDADRLAESFRRAALEAELSPDGSMLRLRSPAAVTKLPGFKEGLFTIQDITACLAVGLLQPRPGWRILDMCAAPGTKTAQLAELTAEQAEIIAADIDPVRLEKVTETIRRLGLTSVRVAKYDNIPSLISDGGLFDCVLLDVPCSNTGVLSRRPEVRYRIRPQTIQKLCRTQLELLQKASQLIKPGGKICYSTCSIQPQENDRLISSFLNGQSAFRLENDRLTLPSTDDCDGGYVAIIGRLL